jgi:hypothetical protein
LALYHFGPFLNFYAKKFDFFPWVLVQVFERNLTMRLNVTTTPLSSRHFRPEAQPSTAAAEGAKCGEDLTSFHLPTVGCNISNVLLTKINLQNKSVLIENMIYARVTLMEE